MGLFCHSLPLPLLGLGGLFPNGGQFLGCQILGTGFPASRRNGAEMGLDFGFGLGAETH